MAKKYKTMGAGEIRMGTLEEAMNPAASPKRFLYVAYGSNLDTMQMAKRCPQARPVCSGWLNDHRLTFQGATRKSGVANVVPATGERVPVGLWSITRRDLGALDKYEGFPWLYKRRWMDVECDGVMVEAIVYIMQPEWDQLAAPGQDYVDTIAFGYADFSLDTEYLKAAIRGVGEAVS